MPGPFATIAKRFTFDAAHRLDTLPPDHKCHRMHGHTYEVELVLIGVIDPLTGMIVDYAEIQRAYDEAVHQILDHRTLNDIPGLEIPTTENLVHWIIRRIAKHPALRAPARGAITDTTWLARVRVKESSTTWCEANAYAVDGTTPWHLVWTISP